MKAYHDFRLFYNQSIHPELMHIEGRRQALVKKIYLTSGLCVLVLIFGWVLGVFLVNLLILLGVGVAISRLVTEVRMYYQSFKPRVVGALLDFFDNSVNYSNLSYEANGSISKHVFLASGLYVCSADEYHAEDKISGKIREMPFELCELRVADISPVRSGMDEVFKGVFIVADYLRPDMRGALYIMPDVYRKYQAQSTRAADRSRAHRVDKLLLPEFESLFDTYATESIKPTQVLTAAFQRSLIEFYRGTKRNISLSIIDSQLYIALYQNEDLLEPSLWKSSVSYEQMHQYQDDLQRVFAVIHAMDVLN
jgi:Protein of unknown function (DUF3137)